MAFVVVLLIGLLVGVSLLIAWAFRRAIKRQQQLAALHAPLLDSDTSNRLQVALRDAQAPARTCAVCAFEVAPHTTHCSLCGSKIPALHGDGTPRSTGALLRQWRSLTRAKSPQPTDSPIQDEHELLRQLNTRQRRARNRKEWTRRLHSSAGGGVTRQMTWHRQSLQDASSLAKAVELDEGYVVSYRISGEGSGPLTKADSADCNEGSAVPSLNQIVVIATDPDTVVNSEHVPSAANSEPAAPTNADEDILATVSRVITEIVTVRDGSSAMLGLDSPLLSSAFNMQTFASVVVQAFPAKYVHFVTEASALLGAAATQPRVPLKISRKNAYDESMAVLSRLPSQSVRAPINVQFESESGVDAGGLFRDWLTLMSSGLVESTTTKRSGGDDSKRTTVFVATDTADEAFHLRGNCSYSTTQEEEVEEEDIKATREAIENAFAAGRFIGRALLEGYPLGFHLSLPLLKLMVGVPVSFSDLEYLDCESHRSLVWVLENDGVDALCLDFTTTESVDGGEMATVELVPGGADVSVTDANKREFVLLKFRHVVFSRVDAVLYPFLKGVYEVVPMDLLAIFDPEELDYVLSGSDEVDVADWRRNTKYTTDLHGHMAMRWFWELVEEMPNEYRRRLLRFSTGSSRVPLGGFAALTSYDGRLSPFTLRGVSWMSSGGYIRSHACFNRLDLPLYVDRDDLKRMLFAILESEGAGFTME